MDKGADDFGAAVREALGSRGLSLRQAQIKTNIDHTTILKMSKGWRPKKGVLIDFAVGLSEPINKWLQLAGYDPLPTEPVKTAGSEPPGEESPVQFTVPDIPESITEAIASADTKEEKVTIAYSYLKSLEKQGVISFGAHRSDIFDTRLRIIRTYEGITGKQLLPHDLKL